MAGYLFLPIYMYFCDTIRKENVENTGQTFASCLLNPADLAL